MDVVSSGSPTTTVIAKSVEKHVMDKTLLFLIKGVESAQPRLILKALRQNVSVRKYITGVQVRVVVSYYVEIDFL